jgi:hypothetical protein
LGKRKGITPPNNLEELLRAAIEAGSIDMWQSFEKKEWTSSDVDKHGWSLDLVEYQSKSKVLNENELTVPPSSLQTILPPNSWPEVHGFSVRDNTDGYRGMRGCYHPNKEE